MLKNQSELCLMHGAIYIFVLRIEIVTLQISGGVYDK